MYDLAHEYHLWTLSDEYVPAVRDQVVVQMPYADFTYQVERTRIVAPGATWVTRRIAYDRLVLTACHPLYSASQRIVVFARLVQTVPRGEARQLGTSRGLAKLQPERSKTAH